MILDPWLQGHGEWHLVENARYFGSECDGGFADYVTIRAANTVPIKSLLSDAELATFPTVLNMAEHLVWRADPQPGEWVVIAGASGGVGPTAIRLSPLRGARVVAKSTSQKTESLTALGCSAVADRNSASLADDIRDAAEGWVSEHGAGRLPIKCGIGSLGIPEGNPVLDDKLTFRQ